MMEINLQVHLNRLDNTLSICPIVRALKPLFKDKSKANNSPLEDLISNNSLQLFQI
jgi:hypothetical protein